MSLPTLPLDVLVRIIHELPHGDLRCLSLTSKAWYNLLAEFLYRTIRIERKNVLRVGPLIKTLANPRLDVASHVRIFAINMTLIRFEGHDQLASVISAMHSLEEYHAEETTAFTPAVCDALSQLPNLRSLGFHVLNEGCNNMQVLPALDFAAYELLELHFSVTHHYRGNEIAYCFSSFFSNLAHQYAGTLRRMSFLVHPKDDSPKYWLPLYEPLPRLQYLAIPVAWLWTELGTNAPNLQELYLRQSYSRSLPTVATNSFPQVKHLQCGALVHKKINHAFSNIRNLELGDLVLPVNVSAPKTLMDPFECDLRAIQSSPWPIRRLAFQTCISEAGGVANMCEPLRSLPFLEELSITIFDVLCSKRAVEDLLDCFSLVPRGLKSIRKLTLQGNRNDFWGTMIPRGKVGIFHQEWINSWSMLCPTLVAVDFGGNNQWIKESGLWVPC